MATGTSTWKILVISDYRSVVSARPEAEIFIQLAQRGHRIHILSYPDAGYYNARFRAHGITVLETHPSRKLSPGYIRYLRRLIRQETFDFVHAFNSTGLTNAVWAMIGLPGKLIAYRGYEGHIHRYDPMMYLKYLHPRVDSIICLSEPIRKLFIRHMPWAPGKAVVIPKGHDPAWYADVIPADRASMPIPVGDVWLAMIANLRPFKRLDVLLAALQRLPDDLPLQVLFIGKGYEAPDVSAQFAAHPWRDRMHRLGFRRDALSILAACDSLVLPSSQGEALNKAVIECMCLGLPPVMTDLAGNSPLAVDGENAWIVPVGDAERLAGAIQELVKHPEERMRRGANARLHIATKLNTAHTVDGFEQLYAALKA